MNFVKATMEGPNSRLFQQTSLSNQNFSNYTSNKMPTCMLLVTMLPQTVTDLCLVSAELISSFEFRKIYFTLTTKLVKDQSKNFTLFRATLELFLQLFYYVFKHKPTFQCMTLRRQKCILKTKFENVYENMLISKVLYFGWSFSLLFFLVISMLGCLV